MVWTNAYVCRIFRKVFKQKVLSVYHNDQAEKLFKFNESGKLRIIFYICKKRVRLGPFELGDTLRNKQDEGDDDMLDIALAPTSAANYYRHVLSKGYDQFTALSTYFVYIQSDGILAKTKKGNN